jgi:prepilin-type N-terminal cleavage/methylation domain-containing protein
MKNLIQRKVISGFTLVEVMVAVAVFALFATGVYGGIQFLYKIVYLSRVRILETSILSEELETIRSIEYSDIGLKNGIPLGIIPRTRIVQRNGIDFVLITTVRNIDDPFDGMATGTTQVDHSSADYKTVELSIMCVDCIQKKPVIATSLFSANGLEGMSDAGALYVTVFDASGNPLPEASIHIVNSSTNPFTVIDDITDGEGMLKINGAPTGTMSYNITISKDGMLTTGTVAPSVSNPNPVKPPATIKEQEVTSISFAIDLPSSILVHTLAPNCSVLSGGHVSMRGEKLIGNSPNIYKTDLLFDTDGSGEHLSSNLEWDTFYIFATGTSHTMSGSIPVTPVKILAGSDQEVTLIYSPYTPRSLLMSVVDQGTELPLSDVTVNLYRNTYNRFLTTDLGYSRQTDWYGGGGQEFFIDGTKYWVDNGGIRINPTTFDLELKKYSGNNYATDGWLESSTFDLGSTVDFQRISWDPVNQQTQTGVNSVKVQFATSNSSSPAVWDFYGPDGTTGTYFTATSTQINSVHDGQRYFRYKIFLHSANSHYTPKVSEVSVTYTNACVPPGQVFFSGLDASTTSTPYNFSATKTGYVTATGTIGVVGNELQILMMSEI